MSEVTETKMIFDFNFFPNSWMICKVFATLLNYEWIYLERDLDNTSKVANVVIADNEYVNSSENLVLFSFSGLRGTVTREPGFTFG